LLTPVIVTDAGGFAMWNRCEAGMAVTVALLPLIAGCTVGGAAAGGVIGHETTHSTAGTLGGAVAGSVIGHELGK
jgi:osmotically inducible lipoprotein OsmB